MLNDAELLQIIGPILDKWLSHRGLVSFSLDSGEDHDGDPALFITARFGSDVHTLDTPSLLDSLNEIRSELRKHSDPRLPYMRYQFPSLDHEAAA